MPEFRELLDGYHRFRRDEYHRQRGRWEELQEGQRPPIMIVACCDSRVDPATVFDLTPGQAFVLRNVANIVPPRMEGEDRASVSSAIEFAVESLGVRHIVIMGHGACGGIAAALAGEDLGEPGPSFIDHWINLLKEPKRAVMERDVEDPQLELEYEAVRQSLRNLETYDFISRRVKDGALKLHGVHFTIGKGQLLVLDEASGDFVPE